MIYLPARQAVGDPAGRPDVKTGTGVSARSAERPRAGTVKCAGHPCARGASPVSVFH